jgi:hypothetical protein
MNSGQDSRRVVGRGLTLNHFRAAARGVPQNHSRAVGAAFRS